MTHAPARSMQKLNLRGGSSAIQITCHGETGFYGGRTRAHSRARARARTRIDGGAYCIDIRK